MLVSLEKTAGNNAAGNVPPNTTEEVIYKLAVSMLDQSNKPFVISDLYQNSLQLGLSPQEVNACIYNLLKKKMLVEGSKLTRDAVIENSLRKNIVAYVNKNPGSIARDIRREFNVDHAESKWHLQILEKFAFLRSKRIGKYLSFYPATLPEEHDVVLCYLRHDTAYRVFYDVFVNPNTTAGDIAQRLSINSTTVNHHLSKFSNTQLVYVSNGQGTPQAQYMVNNEVWTNLLEMAPGLSS